jgi:hypothetical protein
MITCHWHTGSSLSAPMRAQRYDTTRQYLKSIRSEELKIAAKV